MGSEMCIRDSLSDVAVRLPDRDSVNFLTPEQNQELLNWDAEKYRQALNNKEQMQTGIEVSG